MTDTVLLSAQQLRLTLPDRAHKPPLSRMPRLPILNGVDLELREAETLALVGESGSGKTSLGRTLLRLLKPSGGKIMFQGRDITTLSDAALRPLRADMQMIFQDPQSSLNPRHRIGTILAQPLWAFKRINRRRQATRAAHELLERVGLPSAFVDRFPHQLSGGQRQRVGIARAIALRPKLVVADEIVSGLDVSSQAQILSLLQELKRDLGLALVFISHDLSVVRALCDRVLVLRHGEAVETGPCDALFASPKTDYTRELLAAIPLPVVESDPSSVEPNIMSLNHCIALVTGANRGIGREFVTALLARGAKKVYACARDTNASTLTELAAAHPGRVEIIKLDITNFEHIASAAGRCSDTNLLINNAGINYNQGLIASDDLDPARIEMNTNYFGTLALCRTFAPILKHNGGGAIVNMLSILAHVNLPLMGSLCASKAASFSMTQGVRAELAAQGTRVIAVMPGAVDTDMSRDFPPPKMPPAEVANATLDALINGVDDVYPGAMASDIAAKLSNGKALEREFAAYLPAGVTAPPVPEPDPVWHGGCFCGAVRFEVAGKSFTHTDCQCASCRRINGADKVSWITVPQNRFTLESGELAWFNSSQKGRRGFCAQCGTTLAYEVDVFPDDIDITAASFEQRPSPKTD